MSFDVRQSDGASGRDVILQWHCPVIGKALPDWGLRSAHAALPREPACSIQPPARRGIWPRRTGGEAGLRGDGIPHTIHIPVRWAFIELLESQALRRGLWCRRRSQARPSPARQHNDQHGSRADMPGSLANLCAHAAGLPFWVHAGGGGASRARTRPPSCHHCPIGCYMSSRLFPRIGAKGKGGRTWKRFNPVTFTRLGA